MDVVHNAGATFPIEPFSTRVPVQDDQTPRSAYLGLNAVSKDWAIFDHKKHGPNISLALPSPVDRLKKSPEVNVPIPVILSRSHASVIYQRIWTRAGDADEKE